MHILLNAQLLCPSTIKEIARDLNDSSYATEVELNQALATYDVITAELWNNMGEKLPPFSGALDRDIAV